MSPVLRCRRGRSERGSRGNLLVSLTTVPILKIGIQTVSLRQPLRQALATASRLGADGVAIDVRTELPPAQMTQTALRHFRKLLSDLNLSVSAVTFMTRRGYDAIDELERRVMATQTAMKFARELGTDVVINRIGHVPTDENDPRFTRLVEVLTTLGTYGERAGARLAAQTGSESGADLARLLAKLPPESVGVDLHPSGLIHHGFSPIEAVEALGPHVLHVHACDAVRDLARGQAVDVELGRGTADVPGLLGRLEEFNYRGWATIERHNAGDPVAEVANAVAYLRSL
jgi:sugar phosphate isomerase/epimerase